MYVMYSYTWYLVLYTIRYVDWDPNDPLVNRGDFSDGNKKWTQEPTNSVF